MSNHVTIIGNVWLVDSMINADKFWSGIMLAMGIVIMFIGMFVIQELDA